MVVLAIKVPVAMVVRVVMQKVVMAVEQVKMDGLVVAEAVVVPPQSMIQ